MTPEQELQLALAAVAAIQSAITSIVASLQGAQSGAVDPNTALAQIQALANTLSSDDSKAESSLNAKFPTTPSPAK